MNSTQSLVGDIQPSQSSPTDSHRPMALAVQCTWWHIGGGSISRRSNSMYSHYIEFGRQTSRGIPLETSSCRLVLVLQSDLVTAALDTANPDFSDISSGDRLCSGGTLQYIYTSTSRIQAHFCWGQGASLSPGQPAPARSRLVKDIGRALSPRRARWGHLGRC